MVLPGQARFHTDVARKRRLGLVEGIGQSAARAVRRCAPPEPPGKCDALIAAMAAAAQVRLSTIGQDDSSTGC